MRVDELPLRQRRGELGPQLVDVDVHRTVRGPQRLTPHGAVELLPPDDAILATRPRCEQLQLPDGGRPRPPAGDGEVLVRPDLQRSGLDHLAAWTRGARGLRGPRRV